LHINGKAVIYNSPRAVAIFDERRNLVMIAELSIQIASPLILVKYDVRCPIALGVIMVPVVGKCAANKVVLISVSRKDKT
jgi:hypothetical protein